MSPVCCGVCLKKIDKNENKILPCTHIFHASCIVNLAFDCDEGYLKIIKPCNNKHIYLFPKNINMFKCPTCKIKYTHNICNYDIKKVLGRIRVKNNGDDMVHYITDYIELINYVPASELNEDGKMSLKWREILGDTRLSFQIGDDYTHAMVNDKNKEFILCNNRLKISPLDPTTGKAQDGQYNVFRMAEMKELNLLINDL